MMKKIGFFLGWILVFAFLSAGEAEAQGIIKKLKDKAEDKVVDKVFKEDDKTEGGRSGESSGGSSGGRQANRRGEGLKQTPPDIAGNIKSAETSYSSGKYGEARYAVRQAILGVELEIGKNILESLPTTIEGLPVIPEEDNVTSSGIGFVGLIIERVYRKGEKELVVTVGNDAGLLSAVNMYLSSGMYATSTEQDFKRVTFKDHPAVIEYDDYSGYKLSVPFGQSSILIVQGINFDTEPELMSAAENIDIERIKKELGEK